MKQDVLPFLPSRLTTDVICVTERDTELPEELRPFVNWKMMRERVLKNHFEPLFNAIGVSWEEVITGKKDEQFDGKVVRHHKSLVRPRKEIEFTEEVLGKWIS